MEILNLNGKDNKLFYTGGVVRDEILNAESFDVDLTYEGNAIEFAKNIKGLKILKVNEPFGTVRVLIKNKEVDIASTRAEKYEKAGHLPTVTKIGCSLKEDVLRRDFTINALAKNVHTGEIIDFTGGLSDIKNKTIKVLHDNSFIDDPTRILRALKFAVRLNFKLDEHTKLLRDNYLKNINYDMSFKRLKKELIETFNLNSQIAYEEFINAKIYKLVTPKEASLAKINIENFIDKYKKLINPDNIWLIYLGTIEDLSNLELTKEEQKIINDYNTIKNSQPKNDYEIYKLFESLKPESVLLYGIMVNVEIAERYLSKLKNINVNITGKDIKSLGILPSSKYNNCFEYILKEKLKNPKLSYKEELILAKKFFEKE